MRILILAIALVALPSQILAQRLTSHSYLPLDHWSTQVIQHLIDRGVLPDPTPLVRPWTVAAITRALESADTAQMSSAERGAVRQLRQALATNDSETYIAVEGEVAVRASNNARRPEFSLRHEGPGNVMPLLGANLAMQFGPGLILMHPRWDKNVDYDPDFGGLDRPVKVRFLESYAGYRSRYFDLDVGAVSRNWGPPGLPGLLVSSWPLSYEHVYVRLGPERLYLKTMIAQLDQAPDLTGVQNRRYFLAHRLTSRPWKWLDLAVWEGHVFAGPQRSLDLWYLNPFRIHFQTRDELRERSNVWVGGDGEIRVGKVKMSGALTIDDIQLFNTPEKSDEPPSYALTATLTAPVGPLALWIGYTQVSNLMYRPITPAEKPLIGINPERGRVGTGLARNFSDYDQASLRATLMPHPGVLVGPELTLLRQGEGDIRKPFPAREDFPNTRTVFQGIVERIWRAAWVSSVYLPIGIAARIDVGVHRVQNADHIEGETRTDFVGSVLLRYALGGTIPVGR